VAEAQTWTDQSYLRNVQYRGEGNLAARQSIYAYQRPRRDLAAEVIGRLGLGGAETVADVGCGNGLYLAELARRGHGGAVLGIDMSPGMLAAASLRAAPLPAAALLAGDATALPLGNGVSDMTLAAHMLYHVPKPEDAVRELRRVTRAGGLVVVTLNGTDHLLELRDLINIALDDADMGSVRVPRERITLEQGELLLTGYFGSVTRHDFAGDLMLPGPEPAIDYLRSMVVMRDVPDSDRLVSAVTARVRPDDQEFFRVRTHTGCLICR